MAVGDLTARGTLGYRNGSGSLSYYLGRHYDDYSKDELWSILVSERWKRRPMFFNLEAKHKRRMEHKRRARETRLGAALGVLLGLPLLIAALAGVWRLAVYAVMG